MLIEIEDSKWQKVKEIVRLRNKTLYKEIDAIEASKEKSNPKTDNVKQRIRESIAKMLSEGISPTKYKVHQDTGIAYATLRKYYEDIEFKVNNTLVGLYVER